MKLLSYGDAKKEGKTFYFTGKPCSKGHVAQRYVSGRACVTCTAENTKRSHEANADSRSIYHKNWKANNRARCSAATNKWRERNPDYGTQYARVWRDGNRDKHRENQAKRRAIKARAIPAWADVEAIKDIYVKAELLTKKTGIDHHVDHVVPLNSPLVCGLHWEGNMQILTAQENMSKGNRAWPDMPNMLKGAAA